MTIRIEDVMDVSTRLKPKPEIKVTMSYLGADLSVNHYKYGRYTKPRTKQWMESLAWIVWLQLNNTGMVLVPPINIRVDGYFKDSRFPDLANLHKVIGDAIEDGLTINDKQFRFQDGDVRIDKEPRLVITIS